VIETCTDAVLASHRNERVRAHTVDDVWAHARTTRLVPVLESKQLVGPVLPGKQFGGPVSLGHRPARLASKRKLFPPSLIAEVS
jgi:hypothetical protein